MRPDAQDEARCHATAGAALMGASVPQFPLSRRAPIRRAIPAPDPDLNWTLIVAMVLYFAVVIGVSIAAWRFFHG